MTTTSAQIGPLMREWRQRRKLSQLDLALTADTSARHLSYLETGRSKPSRAMVLRLCEALEVPLRERNTLLLAAGFAPAYQESRLDATELSAARAAIDTMLRAHEPYPAVVVDRWWDVVAGNAAMPVLMIGVPEQLLLPRPNVYRLVLHPDGLARRLENLHQVRELFLERLHRQAGATGDDRLRALYDEVNSYPAPPGSRAPAESTGPFQVPIRVTTPTGTLSMFSTMATFGAPADVTLSELAIEFFYPLDDATATALRAMSDAQPPG
ncbi:helix-turn-helix transcriptional regulator [Nocardia salmonicida]